MSSVKSPSPSPTSREKIQKEFGNDLRKFRSNYAISDDAMFELRPWRRRRGITINEELFAKDKNSIATRLKAELARGLWGNEGFWSTIQPEDNQLLKALTLFPEAAKIAGLAIRPGERDVPPRVIFLRLLLFFIPLAASTARPGNASDSVFQ